MMSFDRPLAWLALLALLPLIASMIHAVKRLQARRARYAEAPAMERMAVSGNESELLLRMGLVAGALFFGVVALTGPRLGGTSAPRAASASPSLVIALDVSDSMRVMDVEGGRFDRARAIMTEVVEGLDGWKVGLVAFADEAQVFCPLTSDARALVTLAQRARPGSELRGGTNLEAALRVSQAQLGDRPGAILLLTDGEALGGEAKKAVPALRESGSLLLAMGVGTERGGRITSGTDLFGQPIYRTYRGVLVNSQRDERALKALAAEAGGRYLDASQPGVAQEVIALLQARWKGSPQSVPGVSLSAPPLVLALVLLLADVLFGVRQRLPKLSFARVLNATLRRGGHLIVLLALLQPAFTWPWAGALAGAARSYEAGDYPQALSQVEAALRDRPDDPRLLYDHGCALYQTGDYAGAVLAFKKALDRVPDDSSLRPWIHYNLGNALVRQSERSGKAQELLQAAAVEYEQVLELDSTDGDAQHNLEVVRARLTEAAPEAPKPAPGASGNSPAPGTVPDMPDPDAAEVEALLDALEHDERQRQAEAAQPRQAPATAGDLMRQLLRQGPDASQPDRKDW